MPKIILLDLLGCGKGLFNRHRHFLKDWTGGWMLGFFSFPPLDLIYAASYLRKQGFSDVRVVEANAKHIYPQEVIKLLREEKPDFILIPSTYFTLEADLSLSRLIRKNLPEVKIIFSGPLVTYDPAIVLKDNSADFVALGELELPVLNIIKGNYSQNIARLKDGQVVSGERSLIDLKELPVPARDLIDNQLYKYAIFNRRNPVTPMTISRGCPHSKCEFCNSNLYSLGQIRYRPLSSITEELDEIAHKYKIGEIFFRDQAFTADKNLVASVCEYMLSHKLNLLWRAQTRVDLVDKEILSLMQQAGCYQISFGFESCSQYSLDLNNKGITVEQSRTAARLAKQAGLEVVGLFIYGMPGDTRSSIRKISDFAVELGLDYVNLNELYILPGNKIYDSHIKDKKIIGSNKNLKKLVRSGYARFYLRPKSLGRLLGKIKNYEDVRFLVRASLDEVLSHL
jgi:radical SAM superfamily enzyme YgiQ (UPF0313 family)